MNSRARSFIFQRMKNSHTRVCDRKIKSHRDPRQDEKGAEKKASVI